MVIAPDATDEAKEIFAAKKNLRLLLTGGLADSRAPGLLVKSVAGGFLVQSRDARNADDLELKVVSKRAPSAAELSDMKFAFKVAKHVKSNAIVYAKDGATVGIGAGQMSRVELGAHRSLESRRSRENARSRRAFDRWLGRRLRCIFSVCRWSHYGCRSGRHGRHPAGRINA